MSTLEEWLSELASKQPAPGGGAAAALSAAVSAALLGMVSTYTTGPKWADRQGRMQAINTEVAKLRSQALTLMQADADAFAKVGAAYRLPKTTADEQASRQAAIQAALTAAADPPGQVVELASGLTSLAGELVDTGNPNVISDVAVAASNARAALEAAIANIEINQQLIKDAATKHDLQSVVQKANESIAMADLVVQAVHRKVTGT